MQLIDHQAFQFDNLNSHDPRIIANNVIALAKVAKVFGVPVILTTVTAERGGHIIKGLQDMCFRTTNPSTGPLSTLGRTSK